MKRGCKLKRFIAFGMIFAMTISCQNAEAAKAAKADAVKLTAKQIKAKKLVKLSWKKKSGVKKYMIYRSVKKTSGYKKLTTVTAKVTKKKVTYKDKTVKYGKTYYYKVKAKGLTFSKAVKVKVKAATADTSYANTPTPVPQEQNNNTTGSNTNNSTGDNVNSGNDGSNNTGDGNNTAGNDNKYENTVNINNDTMPTPVPVATAVPSQPVNIEALGTENEDYYVISDSATSSEISEVADITDGNIIVKASTTLVIGGNMTAKQITSQTADINLNIVLNNAAISVEKAPFIDVAGENSNVTIVADKGTLTTITSNSAEEGVELINSNGTLSFGGEGTINIVHNSNVSNAVKAEGEVRLSCASLNVTSGAKGIVGKPVIAESGNVVINAADDGIKAKGKNGFILSGATLDVTSSKDGVNSNKLVQITSGTLKVNATGDGIQCGSATFNETDKVFEVDDGEINIYGGTIDISSANAGIKGNCKVNISGGDININSQAKGIKAGATYEYPEGSASPEYTYEQTGYLNIYGGNINITSKEHALSANGNIADKDNDVAVVIKGGRIEASVDATYTKSSQSSNGGWGGGFGGGMESQKTTYTVTGEDAINSNTGIYISDADVTITKAADAIQAESNLYVYNSNVNITAYAKGLKAGYIVDSTGKGTLEIGGGVINIASFDDCIHCNNNVHIAAGDMTLSTADDGVHADNELKVGVEMADNSELIINITPGTLDNVSISPYEGLEGAYIYVYSGDVDIEATDDGINGAGGTDSSGTTGGGTQDNFFGRPGGGFGGGGMMSTSKGEYHMYGGDIYILAQGDSIDINGNIEITAGCVKIDGSDNGADDVLDHDGTLTITGGTVVAAGKKGMDVPSASGSTTQNYAVFLSSSGISARAAYKLTDESGNIIAEGTTMKQNSLFFFTDSKMIAGTYTFYVNDAKKATVTFTKTGECKQVSF